MGFILIHFVLNVFFPLNQGFQILFHLLFGQFTLLGFGTLIGLILILLLFIVGLFFILLVLFILLLLFLFFKQGFNEVFSRRAIGRIQAESVFPGINTFIQFFLAYHGHAFIIISALPCILICLRL